MKRVAILQPAVPSYRLPFFETLILLGIESGINYEIYSPEQFDETKKKGNTYCRGHFHSVKRFELKFKNRSLFFHIPISAINKSDLIIAEYAIHNLITFWWAIFPKNRKLALWGHGKTYTKKITRLEMWLKGKLANKCDWFFSYTKGGASALTTWGFPISQITMVQNSTDSLELVRVISTLKETEIISFKERNKIESDNTAIFIGSLETSKRLEFLVASAERVQAIFPDFKLLIFGSGPEEMWIQEQCKNMSYLQFCGIANIEDKALASQTCKFIMMPGRVGLIAVDSLAMGLPIITTSWEWHAPEFEYLVHESNAIIAENSLDSYVSAIEHFLKDKHFRTKISINAKRDSNNYGIRIMAENFHSGVLHVVGGLQGNENSN